MQLTVLLFASYADAFGFDRVPVTVADGATVRDLVEVLRGLPGGERLPRRPLVARNRRQAGPDQVLLPDDEIALIPPVAGG